MKMLFEKEIQESFEKNALIYLSQDFDKHKNYLLKAAFRNTISKVAMSDVQDALETFKTDMGKGVKELFNAFKPAIEEETKTLYNRSLVLVDKHEKGQLNATDTGNGLIEVQSDNARGKSYEVKLDDLTCTCPHFEKIKFAGLLCKHIFFANEIFGKSRPASAGVDVDNIAQPEILATESTEAYFSYGSQKLIKRPRRGNSLIPSGITYAFEGSAPEMAIYALETGESLLLIGESGVGKSRLIQYLAQETNTPLLNACGHREITVENLLGSLTVINGNTVWKDGILPSAMRRGYWLLLDEINSIDPGVMKVINELLDTKRITITVAGEPRLVKAHRDFRLVCAMNPPDSPIYKGIETMSFEFMDRFDTVVYLDYLSPETEAKLIMDMTGYGNEKVAKNAVQFANTIRKAMKEGEIFSTVTTRSLISFCRKAKSFNVSLAAKSAILGKMSKTDSDKASDIFKAIFK